MPLRFTNAKKTAARDVSMERDNSPKLKYFAAWQDDDGINLQNLRKWQREGIVNHFKIEGEKLLVSLADPELIPDYKAKLGVVKQQQPRNYQGSGRKARGGSRLQSEVRKK